MLTGDISSEIETRIINDYSEDLLDIDVLKLSHHGSYKSNSYRFLESTSPKITVASVGENTYGHPSNETIQRIVDYDSVYSTDLYNNFYTSNKLGSIKNVDIKKEYMVFGNNKTVVTEAEGTMWKTKEPAIMYFFKNSYYIFAVFFKTTILIGHDFNISYACLGGAD